MLGRVLGTGGAENDSSPGKLLELADVRGDADTDTPQADGASAPMEEEEDADGLDAAVPAAAGDLITQVTVRQEPPGLGHGAMPPRLGGAEGEEVRQTWKNKLR